MTVCGGPCDDFLTLSAIKLLYLCSMTDSGLLIIVFTLSECFSSLFYFFFCGVKDCCWVPARRAVLTYYRLLAMDIYELVIEAGMTRSCREID